MPVADFDATIDFLMAYAGDEPIVLTAIVPDNGGVGSRTFKPVSEPDRIRSWLEGLSGKANLYFTVNACRTTLDGRGTKAKKTDIRAMKALHVDIDPRPGEDPFWPLLSAPTGRPAIRFLFSRVRSAQPSRCGRFLAIRMRHPPRGSVRSTSTHCRRA